jgi:2'-5' RNA ligase
VSSLRDGDSVELSFDGVGLFRRGRAWVLAEVTSEFVARQERAVSAVLAAGADLHKHYQHGMCVPHCSVAPRASLAQLPALTATVYDVLPLRARLDHEALVSSATGGIWPVGLKNSSLDVRWLVVRRRACIR